MPQTQSPANTAGRERTASPRCYLMCRPTYFDVTYSINPWMRPEVPTSAETGLSQWKMLFETFVGLGHDVRLIEPVPGLPDMVFAANGAIVIDSKVLVARFRHPQRMDESEAFLEWFGTGDWSTVHQAEYINEGEGDFLFTGTEILAGSGFRSDLDRLLGRDPMACRSGDHPETWRSTTDEQADRYSPVDASSELGYLMAQHFGFLP